MNLSRPYAVGAALALALIGAATAGVVAHASAKTRTITVTEREFRIHLSTTKTKAGTVRFVVKNAGRVAHALAISGPGVKLKRTAAIEPGKTVRLVVKLRGGKYSLWCPFHSAEGMKATLRVKGAVAVTTPSTTTPPTTTSGGGGSWG
jgi:plastocyanin